VNAWEGWWSRLTGRLPGGCEEKQEVKYSFSRLALLTEDSAVTTPFPSTSGSHCLLGESEWYKAQNYFGERNDTRIVQNVAEDMTGQCG